MRRILFSAVLIFTLAAHGQDAKAPTVIRGHHIGESYREYLAASQSHEISDCDWFLADPQTVKVLQKITKKTGHNFESMTSYDEIGLEGNVTLPSGDQWPMGFWLDKCREIRARLDTPANFKAISKSGQWDFLAGKLVQMKFDFGAKDYFGKVTGPDASFDDVVSDFTAKFGEPERGVETLQNGFGAVFTFKTAKWKLSDVYIAAEEKRPEVIGLAQTPSTVVKVVDRATVDKQE